MPQPLINQFATMVFDASSQVPSASSSTAPGAAVTSVPLDKFAGEPWLNGQTNGYRFEASSISSGQFIRMAYSNLGVTLGANQMAYLIFDVDSDFDIDYRDTYLACEIRNVGAPFADRINITATLNNRPKQRRLVIPFFTSIAQNEPPATRSVIITDSGVPFDFDADIGIFRIFLYNTSDGRVISPVNFMTFVGIATAPYVRPLCSISYDDNNKSVFDVIYPLAKQYEIPFHLYLETEDLEGGPGYVDGFNLTNAELEEMRDYRTPGGKKVVTFGFHGHGHMSMSGYRSKSLQFVAPNQILETVGSLLIVGIRVGSTIIVEGTANNNGTYTVLARDTTQVTVVENTIVNEAVGVDNEYRYLRRDPTELAAQFDTGIPLMAPYWAGTHPTFATPFGKQDPAAEAAVRSRGLMCLRTTEQAVAGNQFNNVIIFDGYPVDMYWLRVASDMGSSENTVAEMQEVFDHMEAVGGTYNEIYGHGAGDGTGTTDFAAAEQPGLWADMDARNGNTLDFVSIIDVVDAVNDPFQVVVPDYSGLTEAEVAARVATDGLRLAPSILAPSPTVASGDVISSTPASGSSVDGDSQVVLTISSGASSGTTLTQADIDAIVLGLLNAVIEAGETVRDQLKLIRAAAAGTIVQDSSGAYSIRSADNTRSRIVGSGAANGGRTVNTTDPT